MKKSVAQWEKMYDVQKEFTKKFFQYTESADLNQIRNNSEKLIQWTKEYVLGMTSEGFEILNEVDWKTHFKQNKNSIRQNVLEELVDVIKYALGLAIIYDFSPDEIFDKFILKSAVINAKFAQHRLKLKIDSLIRENHNVRIVAVDIDGVLSKWAEWYIQFINSELQTNFQTLWEIEQQIPPSQRYSLKEKFRLSGIKRKMPVMEGARAFLKHLHDKGYYILLITARPYRRYYNLYEDTLLWLKRNHLKYDFIFWEENKEEFLIQNYADKITCVIEDNLANARKLAAANFTVYLKNNIYNIDNKFDLNQIVRFDTFEEIYDRF